MSHPAKRRKQQQYVWAWDDQPLRPMANIDKTEWWEMAQNDAVTRELEGMATASSAYQRAFERTVKENETDTSAIHDCSMNYYNHRVRASRRAHRLLVTPTYHGPTKSAAHLMNAFLDTIVANETTGRMLATR